MDAPYYDNSLLGFGWTIAIPTTAAEILPSNPRRVALTFSSSTTGRYTLYFAGASGIVDKGFTIPGSSLPVTLTRAEMGSLIEQAIVAVAATPATVATILEVSRP